MRIEDALALYVTQLHADGRADNTIQQYRRHVLLLSRWCVTSRVGLDVREITPQHLAAFLASDDVRLTTAGQPRNPSSANTIRSSLRTFFYYLHSAGAIPENPARLIRRAICSPPHPRAISDDEVAHLFGLLETQHDDSARRDLVLYQLLHGTGLRIGAALALNMSDLDLERREIHVRSDKRGRSSRLPIGQSLARTLREFVAQRRQGPLFRGQAGGRLTVRQAQRRFTRWGDRAALRDLTLHGFRHARAVAIYRSTRDIVMVKRALNHASILSSAVYVDASSEDIRRLVDTMGATS